MFNVGGGEMVVIFLLALIVLGPERLPKAMGQVGRAVGQLRRMSSGFQDEIRRAMDPGDAPFRPGEEHHPLPPVDDEVRVVADGPSGPPAAPEVAPTEPDGAPGPGAPMTADADPDRPGAG